MSKDVLREERDKLLRILREEGFYYERIKRFDATTWDVNCGYCEDFAEAVVKRIPSAEIKWLDEEDENISHCVVVYQGKYYDAECLEGVEDWHNLPLVKNKGETRDLVLAERESP